MWKADNGGRINLVSANSKSGQVVVSSGKDLYYLEMLDRQIKAIAKTTLEYEVACIDISSIGKFSVVFFSYNTVQH